MSLLNKIDIKIDQDWTKVMSIYDSIEAKWINKEFTVRKTTAKNDVYSIDAEIIDLGQLGFLTPVGHIGESGRYSSFLHGKVFESKLPWIKQFRQDVAELNLHDVMMFKTNGDITRHVDANHETGSSTKNCKLNIVLKDSDATVYVSNGVVTEQHDARANDAWLLDVINPHWVDTTELYLLQFWFYSDYNTVLEWFNRHPGLEYK
jgi:hypothetical protein